MPQYQHPDLELDVQVQYEKKFSVESRKSELKLSAERLHIF